MMVSFHFLTFLKAFCHHLEGSIDRLKQRVQELESELSATKSQLLQSRIQQEVILNALKSERAQKKKLYQEKVELEKKISVPFPELTEVDLSTVSGQERTE